IFERFERGSNAAARGIGGTGIGLAYVREVATAHGGRVYVESKEGSGSTFVMELPRTSVVAPTPAAPAAAVVAA
ncbi:MAG: two-component sensor histidine kinase, partial [Chloroflexi bacterium]|nr:two-component sensor histidine kinase [Chloroflexota bacterium]